MTDRVAEIEAPPSAQEAEESFWCLLEGLEMLRGFGLYLAKCDSEDVRREVTRRAERILEARGTRLVTVDLAGRIDVFDTLAEARGEGPVVLFAHGLERPEGEGDLLRRALVGMNLQRERFRDELRCPVVFWLYGETLALLATVAPDVYDWRSGIYRFPAHAVGETGTLEASRQLALSGSGYYTAKPEAEARLAGLQDLLTDLRDAKPTPANAQALFDVAERALYLCLSAGRFAEALALVADLRSRGDGTGDPLLAAQAAVDAGLAYANLPSGDRAANLRQAIDCCETALRAFTEADFPVEWAITQHNLGHAYSAVPTGDRAANVQRAIECYEAAMRVFTEADFPVQWAMAQHNLGNAYSAVPTGDRAANVQRAIERYEAALRVYTEADFPVQWAVTQASLGAAHNELPTGDRAANQQGAIECYEAALRVLMEADFPVLWAATQNNLGNAYASLPTGDRAANLQQAIDCYEAALRVRTEADLPVDWALTQNNVGVAYARLPAGDRAANLHRAIECYDAALRVLTEGGYPEDWATTQNNLGGAYAHLPAGDRAPNLQRAIECFEAALRVRTEEAFPDDWRLTMDNLARARAELKALEAKTPAV